MIGLMVGAWLFWMTAFCVLGLACRVACRRRRLSGRSCICGRHLPEVRSIEANRPPALASRLRTARWRAAEARVRALQQRYVAGLMSIEQYEIELDKVVGLA